MSQVVREACRGLGFGVQVWGFGCSTDVVLQF